MSARENILARIRANTGKSGATAVEEIAAVRAHIALQQRGPVPSNAHHEPIEHFLQECERLKSTAERVPSRDHVTQAVAGYLGRNGLEKRVVAWPSFSSLDWMAAQVECETRLANATDLVGLTDCFCGIAETGTLLLLGSPTTPKLHALLPETHICVVSAARIVPTMEDAFALLRNECGQLPRATFFVSGPSRTADIEQTIVIGAHGPYRVHVLIVP